MKRLSPGLSPLLLSLLLPACPVEDEPGPPVGEGVFASGCPVPGEARARRLPAGERLEGPDVLGGEGDVLLLNEVAAFVVQDDGEARTWFDYGGNLVDAAPVAGCAQAGPEQFGELNFLVGVFDVLDFPRSTIRAFRPTGVEILSDGAGGGPARVRVHGEDAPFWLIEHELIRRAGRNGPGKRLSEPLGLELSLDYVLEPGSPVLQIELRATNRGSESLELGLGAVAFPSDDTPRLVFSDGSAGIAGVDLPVGAPWIGWASGESAYAFGAEAANLGTTSISGANIIVDALQLGAPLQLPAGGFVSDLRRYFVSVGAGSYNAATSALAEALPEPLPGRSVTVEPLLGTVRDAADGNPVEAEVRVEMRDRDGDWVTYDATRSAGGEFAFDLVRFDGEGERVRLVAVAPGRDSAEPVEVSLPGGPVDLTIGARGALAVRVTEVGAPLPAKLVLRRQDGLRVPIFAGVADEPHPVPPGRYTWTATRGYEYGVRTGELEVPAGGTGELEVEMTRLVDTSGWVAVDTHVHSGPSEDSTVPPETRVLTAAAQGIELFVGSDHEIVTDLEPAVAATGLQDFVHVAVGEELTATSPEHLTAYGMSVDPGRPRGGPVEWAGRGLEEIFAEAEARGVRGIGLNHPRGGCAWMCLIDWDPVTGEPADKDPELLGMAPGTPLWSWDFDFIEYMNGPKRPFRDPGNPLETGEFDDWQAFLNHGHRITALGSSDVHGLEGIGDSRSYLRVGTDDPALLTDDDLVDAIAAGAAVATTGAFARATVDGAGPGETATPAGAPELALRVEALPEVDVDWILVTWNCDEVARFPTDAPDGVLKFEGTVPLPEGEDGHVAVLGFGSERLPDGLRDFDPRRVPRFTTNAIFVDGNTDGVWTPPGGKECDYSLDPPE